MTDRPNVPVGQGSGPTPVSTPSSLLKGLKASDPEAWRRLARLYAPLVHRWCRQRGLQPADAEDVVQEVFRVVLDRVAGFRHDQPGSTFRGWLWAITRNKLGDHFRRCAAGPEAAGGSDAQQQLAQLPAEAPDEGSAEMSGLYRRALEQIRSEFEERSWQAFWRVVVEDRRPADVAQVLGMSANAVYLAKSRILRRLREELGED